MTWDIILAGMIGGLGFGLFCVSMQELWRSGPTRETWRDPHESDCGIRTRGICDCGEQGGAIAATRAERQRAQDIRVVAEWCQRKIDAAVRARDVMWVRRVLK